MENDSQHKYVGMFIMFLATVLNPFLIGYVASQDHVINSRFIIGIIIAAEVLLFALGIIICTGKGSWFMKRKKEILLLLFTLLFTLLLLEIMLRINPFLLGKNFENTVLGKYNSMDEGIYYHDEQLKMSFLKPNFTTMNYYNGYYWIHKTDSNGFRNDVDRTTADIVLLGDSLIYGHGVNFTQTVGYFVENLTGKTVVNLARQGDTVYQEMYLLNQYGFNYQPKYIFYFFSENDITDLYAHQVNITYFLETPVRNVSFLHVPPVSWEQDISLLNKFNIVQKSYIIRAIKMFLRQESIVREKERREKESNEGQNYVKDALAWEYITKAIYVMNNFSERHDAVFVMVPLTFGNEQQEKKLQAIAQQENIPYIYTGSINYQNTTLFLEHDGHLSPEGAKAVAKLVADYLNNAKASNSLSAKNE